MTLLACYVNNNAFSQPFTSLSIEAGTGRRSSAWAVGRGRVWKWPKKTLKSQRGYEASTMSFFLRNAPSRQKGVRAVFSFLFSSLVSN
jgi:hypothetical protein